MPIVSLLAQPFRHPLACLVTVDFFRSVVLQALPDLRVFTGIVGAKSFAMKGISTSVLSRIFSIALTAHISNPKRIESKPPRLEHLFNKSPRHTLSFVQHHICGNARRPPTFSEGGRSRSS